MMNDINNSFESDYDKQEPKLLLCLFCEEEFNIPNWALHNALWYAINLTLIDILTCLSWPQYILSKKE